MRPACNPMRPPCNPRRAACNRRRAACNRMYLQASSSGVLLGVPEGDSTDAEAAEEEADGADAPVRAVLQDALEESDEEVP